MGVVKRGNFLADDLYQVLQQHVLFFMIGNVESLTMSFRYPTVYHRLYLVRYLNGQYYERGRYQEDPLYQITKLLLLATEMNR
jgi:hypothetical protein